MFDASLGWQPVASFWGRGFVEGFDKNKIYEFHRKEWEFPKSFRLADAGDLFNIAGLYWREAGSASPCLISSCVHS